MTLESSPLAEHPVEFSPNTRSLLPKGKALVLEATLLWGSLTGCTPILHPVVGGEGTREPIPMTETLGVTPLLTTETPTATMTETPLPTATKTEKPTPTAKLTDKEKIEKYFIPVEKEQDIIAAGGIILDVMPISEINKLVVDRPGKYYMPCNGDDIKKEIIDSGQLFLSFEINWLNPDGKVCVNGHQTPEKTELFIKSLYPSAPPETIKALLDKEILLTNAMLEHVPDGPFLWDIFYEIEFVYTIRDYKGSWALFQTVPNRNTGKFIQWITITP